MAKASKISVGLARKMSNIHDSLEGKFLMVVTEFFIVFGAPVRSRQKATENTAPKSTTNSSPTSIKNRMPLPGYHQDPQYDASFRLLIDELKNLEF